MSYSVERTLQFGLADVSRLFRLPDVRAFALVLGVLPRLVVVLAGRRPRLAGAQRAKKFEAQPSQSQLLYQIRHRGLLQIADYLARYQQRG